MGTHIEYQRRRRFTILPPERRLLGTLDTGLDECHSEPKYTKFQNCLLFLQQ